MHPTSLSTPPYTLSDFDYDLPPERVAQYPLEKRDQSRMLVLNRKTGAITHQPFRNLPNWLNPGDLLVVNNAKVIPARLIGTREGHTGEVEIFLMHPETQDRRVWQSMMRPARRLKPGSVVVFGESPLTATILEQQGEGRGRVELSWPQSQPLDAVLADVGHMPIPPYLQREAEALDTQRYQTVYASVPGAQASPTAGLHFTPQVLEALKAKGVQQAEVTLNVSAGTFRPILSEAIQDHRMDAEFYTIPPETAAAVAEAKARGNRIIAVGTTVAKTLETSAHLHQGDVQAESAWSELFITPGFNFQVVDTLLTNFHLPKSTLLLLVSAFASRNHIMAAYREAIAQQYRFYSYGDCMLITP